MPFLLDANTEFPVWGLVSLIVGSAVALAYGLSKVSPQLLQIWVDWRERIAALKVKAFQDQLAHEKDRIALENIKTEPFRNIISALEKKIDIIQAKAEETEKAHLKDRLADHEQIVKCREECAACRAELTALKAQRGMQ